MNQSKQWILQLFGISQELQFYRTATLIEFQFHVPKHTQWFFRMNKNSECTEWTLYWFCFLILFADEKNATETTTKDVKECSLALSTQNRLQPQVEKVVANDCSLCGTRDERNSCDESSLDGADVSNRRPMSPRTLALMCDERNTIFTAAASPTGLMDHGLGTSSQLPNGRKVTEAYAEQERVILTQFQDCLNRLINLGKIKGKFLPLAFSNMMIVKWTINWILNIIR